MNKVPSKKSFYAAVISTILVALCCFTPILVITLVITLATVGLGIFTPYLDFVLLPALALCLLLSFLAYRKYKNDCRACGITNLNDIE